MRLLLFALALLFARPVWAEVTEVRMSKQYGLGYMAMLVMERQLLIEKHAAAAGLAGVHATWRQMADAVTMNDALLAGSVDFTGPGVTTLATMWDKTVGTPQEVRAISALQSMPFVLVTRNPDVRSIRDLTAKDKIALPGVKLSGHALTLQFAAAREWGFANFERLDPLTITRSHADAMAAMMSGGTEIDTHFASSPFYYIELARPEFRQILKSYDVWGGRHTNGVVITSKRFYDTNPKIVAAVFAALTEANGWIKANPREAAQIYLEMTGERGTTLDAMATMVADPDVDYTTTPVKVMEIVAFMQKVGRLKRVPARWQDLFFPEAHGLPGS